ncbi:MAG TPA: 7-cyano-7-deazaguanine synthase [Vicinamibacterales bacterium]|jgi:7-cyano-7-deazaguanine synthase|nr:7-cyano-7-deazaguanine synthase [Vicinamibacterales bacterium]
MSEKYSAVLLSGGLDSAVLLAFAAQTAPVVPIYVSVGFAWEAQERRMVERLLASPVLSRLAIAPLATLSFDMRDVYPPSHWAVRGDAPGFDTPDEDVYIDGRNITLLSKASIYMARHDIPRVLMGQLANNPFPDASAEFFGAMARALSVGLAAPIEVATPFTTKSKTDVIHLGLELGVPFELTLSCMQPENGQHCGRCSKCRERRDAFIEAGADDPTPYRTRPLR